jgi:hypothetical protein
MLISALFVLLHYVIFAMLLLEMFRQYQDAKGERQRERETKATGALPGNIAAQANKQPRRQLPRKRRASTAKTKVG